MSNSMNRRRFAKLSGAVGSATLIAPFGVLGQAKPRVVVIGGGAGGATTARYIAKSGAVDVTLVEASKNYTTCFFSNLYLGGFRTFDSITHTYDKLASESITVINERAEAVDTDAKQVKLAGGSSVEYDRLVVAPGIDFKSDAIEGYDDEAQEIMPHAYKPGEQTKMLAARLQEMPDGGVFVIAPPGNPFRCPPGPYERASMIAHYFKENKPKSKILILDAKNKHSKQALFQEGWERFYPGMVEWVPADMSGGGVVAVDAKAMMVKTPDEEFEVAGANIIPAQVAGAIAAQAGLTDDSGWCPVHPETLESKQVPGVHLVGDAIIPGDMPKSAFSANSQAKVCANAILSELTESKRFPAKFRNTCWSLLATDHGVMVGANYEATAEKIAKTDGFISEVGETDELRATTANEANAWYDGITADIFG